MDGKVLRKDEAKGYKFDNLVPEEILIENPYGSYRVEYTRGGEQFGTLAAEEDYHLFVSKVISLANQHNNIKKAVVSKLIDGRIEKKAVFLNDILY